LGCKVNQYDTQAMLEQFLAAGYGQADFDGAADVYVINTCTVTGMGDKKSMQAVRRALRRNPAAAVVIAGCLAQRAGQSLCAPGVRLVLGTQRRGEVVQLLHRAMAEDIALVAVDALTEAPFEALAVTALDGHTRAVLKIQEGCDRFCTYCVIPSVRGPVRSRPLAEVAAEARRLGAQGFREIVITGIHVTSYGKDWGGEAGLLDAIRAVHGAVGIKRVRLSSLEPLIATQAFVDALADLPKLCPHFHLALQSGSDTVLRRMGRRYTAAEFLDACARLRAAFPQAAITTDVMTGFPGETEAEFAQTQDTVARARFARLHVFPYSERQGTTAVQMPGAVPKALRTARARTLIAQGEALQRAYIESLVGTVQPVLWEEDAPGCDTLGYTPQYVRVRARGGQLGAIQPARLLARQGEEALGELCADQK
jgi:threonylcarbamoyladenosine tRNA methylthiotransferase MtaB